MKKGKGRFTYYTILVCIVLLMGCFFVFGDRGLLYRQKLKAELAMIISATETMQKENDQLRKEIELLKNDPQRIEKIARDELGMVKKDELIYKKVK
ncbi:MAG TPA: septum formation initiator family protein [Thermodesulfobacteriota bacterium]|nr:septum formation initiator family protein [Deltaproteobacteria bacterium]HNU72955.1 septum formation initiator family protein [Thermodesulfobacteriota bacterium]